MIVSFKLSIVFKIFVEVSMITSSFTSEGKLACISGSFWCTFLAMFTEFAPELFLYDDHTTFRAVVERFLRTFLDAVLYTGHVVNSGAVHLVDDLIYDLLDVFNGENGEEAINAMKDRYDEAELREAVEELTELKNEGLLFSPEFEVPPTFSETPVLKSLCLHIAHDCNLRCGYCFAGTGDFGGCRALMSKEVAEKAVEFAITGSKKRHNLELDLFGGEPLMNWPVVEHVINYVRRREQETGKNIKLTLTTNGTLLNDENIKFLNDNRVMLVLSLDGKKETHDRMRPFPNHTGSYDAAVRGFKKVIESRHGKNYYLRGTYTHYNPHFCEDTLDMTKIGKEISVEPVVGTDEPYVLTEEDLPVLYEEYDKLARAYLQKRHEGDPFDFFHFNVALDNGPCVAKRLAGCGAGHEYFAIRRKAIFTPATSL